MGRAGIILKRYPSLSVRIRVHDLSIFRLQGHLIEVIKMKDDLLEQSHCGISPLTSHPLLSSPAAILLFPPLSLSPLRTLYPAKTVPSSLTHRGRGRGNWKKFSCWELSTADKGKSWVLAAQQTYRMNGFGRWEGLHADRRRKRRKRDCFCPEVKERGGKKKRVSSKWRVCVW